MPESTRSRLPQKSQNVASFVTKAGIRRDVQTINCSVTCELFSWLTPNEETNMLLVFELSAALALGFVFGRIWQIRQEMRQNGYKIPTAHL